ENTRAYIKIEDGCDRFCSYCIIPKARGRVRSKGIERIAAEAGFHAEDGHREIVLTGINLSCYGVDIGLSLYDAVRAVAEQPLIERVRLSSLEPELLTGEVIDRLAGVDKLCPHFHLSLQSGCSSTLKRMNRHYSAEEYREIVERLRKTFPECGITTDVMVGFAGETDEEFQQSAEFVKGIGFAKVHVFTYSVRPGTRAAEMEGQVPAEIKEQRYRVMSEIAEIARREFWSRNAGTVHKVLIERQTSPEFINGYTENYIPVRIFGGKAKRHDIIEVEITGAQKEFCVGRETT
ncbi:MAG: MiaB/RimO family radical SAM methylthiotransferase, partial [Oscillospiraceae bacterium]|nr:MiaB/RimO family radical SAM methylthiotransferase [Oscillospiraceae bacterium]